jgi:hypothetical protein
VPAGHPSEQFGDFLRFVTGSAPESGLQQYGMSAGLLQTCLVPFSGGQILHISPYKMIAPLHRDELPITSNQSQGCRVLGGG